MKSAIESVLEWVIKSAIQSVLEWVIALALLWALL
jgi:hypothetical protein